MTVIPAQKTKNVTRTAKKPISREKCAAISPISSPKHKINLKSLENLTRYEAGDILARLNGKKGSDMKALKAAMLNDNAKAAAEGNRIPQLIRDALAIADKKPQDAMLKLTIAEKAAKISGALPEQSPDAKQKIELGGNIKRNITINFRKATPEDAK